MATITVQSVQIKRSFTPGVVPTSLLPGEEFVNLADGFRLVGDGFTPPAQLPKLVSKPADQLPISTAQAAALAAKLDATVLSSLATKADVANASNVAAPPAGSLRANQLPSNVSFLLDFKTALGLPAELEDYGGSGNGVVDCSPAISALIAAGKRTVRLREACVYRFNSAWPTIPYGLRVIGHGMSTSVLDFYQTSGQMFLYTGTTDNGGVLEGFTGRARGGATLTAWLYLLANSSGFSPDFFVGRDINFSGFSTAADMASYGILADGNARTGSGLVGLRNLTLDNVKVFSAGVGGGNAVDLRFVKDAGLHRVSAFNTATGATGNNKVSISGTTASSIVHCTALDVGDIGIDYANDVGIDGSFQNLTVTANASRFNISGRGTSVSINAGATDGRVTVNGGCTVGNNAGATVKVTA